MLGLKPQGANGGPGLEDGHIFSDHCGRVLSLLQKYRAVLVQRLNLRNAKTRFVTGCFDGQILFGLFSIDDVVECRFKFCEFRICRERREVRII